MHATSSELDPAEIDTCPLCLSHYPAEAARTCGACGAHSCAACVEPSRSGATLRCFACGAGRPTFVPAPPLAAAR